MNRGLIAFVHGVRNVCYFSALRKRMTVGETAVNL